MNFLNVFSFAYTAVEMSEKIKPVNKLTTPTE